MYCMWCLCWKECKTFTYWWCFYNIFKGIEFGILLNLNVLHVMCLLTWMQDIYVCFHVRYVCLKTLWKDTCTWFYRRYMAGILPIRRKTRNMHMIYNNAIFIRNFFVVKIMVAEIVIRQDSRNIQCPTCLWDRKRR